MSYIKYKVFLSDGQIAKLKLALRKNEEITLQIDKSKSPNYEMYLTKTNINRINEGKRITISKAQLNKNGGFLPFLIPLLTGAATGLGAWGTKKVLDKITGSGNPKKTGSKKKIRKPKNLDSEKLTLFIPKNGKGVYLPREYPMQ